MRARLLAAGTALLVVGAGAKVSQRLLASAAEIMREVADAAERLARDVEERRRKGR